MPHIPLQILVCIWTNKYTHAIWPYMDDGHNVIVANCFYLWWLRLNYSYLNFMLHWLFTLTIIHIQVLQPEDNANTIIYALSIPPRMQVIFRELLYHNITYYGSFIVLCMCAVVCIKALWMSLKLLWLFVWLFDYKIMILP